MFGLPDTPSGSAACARTSQTNGGRHSPQCRPHPPTHLLHTWPCHCSDSQNAPLPGPLIQAWRTHLNRARQIRTISQTNGGRHSPQCRPPNSPVARLALPLLGFAKCSAARPLIQAWRTHLNRARQIRTISQTNAGRHSPPMPPPPTHLLHGWPCHCSDSQNAPLPGLSYRLGGRSSQIRTLCILGTG
jgi:hypothetical protein